MDTRVTTEEAASLVRCATLLLADLKKAKKNGLMFDDQTLNEVKRLKKSLEKILQESTQSLH